MVYANSEDAYESLYEELKSLNLVNVLQYFDDNWHGFKDQWTMFGCNKHSNYMNRTSGITQ